MDELKKHVLDELCLLIAKQTYKLMNGYNAYERFSDDGRCAAYGDVLLRLYGETYDDEDKGNKLIREWCEEHYENGYRTGFEHLDDALEREMVTHVFR